MGLALKQRRGPQSLNWKVETSEWEGDSQSIPVLAALASETENYLPHFAFVFDRQAGNAMGGR